MVPFLGGLKCTVKTYNCAGVMVYIQCSPDFREQGRHIAVDREDPHILTSAEELSPVAEARKKVVSMVLGIRAKVVTNGGYCQAEVSSGSNGIIEKCKGVPVVKPSTSKPGTFFTGCKGYSSDVKNTPKIKRNGFNNRHLASKITLDGPMLDLYRDLLSGKEVPSVEDESPCTFVRGKHKSRDSCPRHGCELVHMSCRAHADVKQSSHTMSIIEPVGYHEATPDERKVLFVSCIGEHLHPASPPVEATAMNLRLFDYLCKEKKWSSLAQLRNVVSLTLQQACTTENGPIRLFDGTFTIPRAVLQIRLRMLRPPVSKLAVEVWELAMMAADEANPYVRGINIVGEKYVVLLGHADLLAFASHRMVFAGDATFKTVTEETREVAEGRWYLYNIVAHASKDRRNSKSVVVMRALVTVLSRDVYCAIWTYFLEQISRAWGIIRGIGNLESVCIKITYVPVPPVMEKRCCDDVAITMDFDSAEILGCADALVRLCGGIVLMHVLGMFMGCSVHLDCDLIRRSRDEKNQERSGKRSSELLSVYHSFIDAKTADEAKLHLGKINSFDEWWVHWVERNCMGSLICKSLSTMCQNSRSLGFEDTNVVESQNRRGKVLIGTHNRPGEAALKLSDVDRLDLVAFREGSYNNIAIPRGFRVRKDYIIAPSGISASTCGKRQRSRGGIGPAQKRIRRAAISGSKSATMCQNKDGAAEDEFKRKASKMKERSPAPAHIKEMRACASSQEIKLSNRVEHHLTKLLDDVGRIPARESDANGPSGAQISQTHTHVLIGLLSAVNKCDSAIEKVKRTLLDSMLIEEVSKDVCFRDAILSIFKMCMEPFPKASEPAFCSERTQGDEDLGRVTDLKKRCIANDTSECEVERDSGQEAEVRKGPISQ